MKFIAVIELNVEPIDEDVMKSFGDAVENRFTGTAIHVDQITIIKEKA